MNSNDHARQLELLRLAVRAIPARGDAAHVWLNYPDKPELTPLDIRAQIVAYLAARGK